MLQTLPMFRRWWRGLFGPVPPSVAPVSGPVADAPPMATIGAAEGGGSRISFPLFPGEQINVTCQQAEAALVEHRVEDALVLLAAFDSPPQPLEMAEPALSSAWRRGRLLLGLAYTLKHEPGLAVHYLNPLVAREDATYEEQLALAQALLMDRGPDAAQGVSRAYRLLGDLPLPVLGRSLAARVKLCTAAIYHRAGQRDRAREHLPPPEDCTAGDRAVVNSLLMDN